MLGAVGLGPTGRGPAPCEELARQKGYDTSREQFSMLSADGSVILTFSKAEKSYWDGKVNAALAAGGTIVT